MGKSSRSALRQGTDLCPALDDGPVQGRHHYVDTFHIMDDTFTHVVMVVQTCTECDEVISVNL